MPELRNIFIVHSHDTAPYGYPAIAPCREVIHRQTGQVDLPEDPDDDSFFGRFRTSRVPDHPTFSNDGRQVLFNSVIDGRVRICAIEIMDLS